MATVVLPVVSLYTQTVVELEYDDVTGVVSAVFLTALPTLPVSFTYRKPGGNYATFRLQAGAVRNRLGIQSGRRFNLFSDAFDFHVEAV